MTIRNASDYASLAATIAVANPGDSIYLPRGTYTQCDLTGITKLTIFGEGTDSVISFNTGNTVAGISGEIVIKNCKITCTGTFDAVEILAGGNLVLEDVTIANTGGFGAVAINQKASAGNLVCTNVIVTQTSTGAAVYIAGGSLTWNGGYITAPANGGSITITPGATACRIYGGDTAWTGTMALLADDITVIGVEVSSTDVCVDIEGDRVRISNCYVHSTTNRAIQVDTDTTDILDLMLVGNTVISDGTHALQHDGSNNLLNAVITGNRFSANPGGVQYTVELNGTDTGVFSGNIVQDPGGAGAGLIYISEGFSTFDGSVDSEAGIRLPGSVNNWKFYNNGTNIYVYYGATYWGSFSAGQLDVAGATFVKSSGIQTGSGSAQFYSTHVTAGLSILDAAGTATDREHQRSYSVTNLTSNGEMLHIFSHNSLTNRRFGITIHGAQAEWLTNRSGGALVTGDVVLQDATDVRSVVKSFSGGYDNNVRGVWWSSSTADNAGGWCVTSGPTKVNVATSTAESVWIETSSTDGRAQAGTYAVFARTLEAEAGNIAMANIMLGMQQSNRVQTDSTKAATALFEMPLDGNKAVITSTSAAIDHMSDVGWEEGAVVTFVFEDGIHPTINHQIGAPPAGSKAFTLAAAGNTTYYSNKTMFKLGATYWEEIQPRGNSRAQNNSFNAQSTVTLGDGNFHLAITASFAIDYITTTGWEVGAIVLIWMKPTVTFNHQTATPPAGTASLNLIGGVPRTFLGGAREVLFKLGATYWEEQVNEF